MVDRDKFQQIYSWKFMEHFKQKAQESEQLANMWTKEFHLEYHSNGECGNTRCMWMIF